MYQINGISSNISDFLFCLSFGEIIEFLCQVTYSWSDVSHLQWNMLHLITITISHMYTNLQTQPLISVGKHDTPGDQKCPYMLGLIQLDWQHNFIRCSKGMQMHLKWGTDIDTVHTCLPPFNPRIWNISLVSWHVLQPCLVTWWKASECAGNILINVCQAQLFCYMRLHVLTF